MDEVEAAAWMRVGRDGPVKKGTKNPRYGIANSQWDDEQKVGMLERKCYKKHVIMDGREAERMG